MYFCDRTGDTFRWRGENVSTVEIENLISKKLNSVEAVVYGVEIPGEEGRAGMCAILTDDLDLKYLSYELRKELPAYAVPLFVRLVKHVEHTGTFKVKKHTLVDEGFNVNKFSDKIYYMDSKLKEYRYLDQAANDEILSGKIRF
jgi:solute carrier family 27 fatty acid transporter 1/4